MPVRSASSTAARPAGAMRPSAVRRATSSRLTLLQALRGLRGEKRWRRDSASCRRVRLSIHPKQRASSTASRWVTLGVALRACPMTSHTSSASPAWASSHARHAARSAARSTVASAVAVVGWGIGGSSGSGDGPSPSSSTACAPEVLTS
jgi:hypothetical protein